MRAPARRRRLLAMAIGIAVAFGTAEATMRVAGIGVETELRSGRNPMARWAQVDAFCAYRAIEGEYLSHRKTVDENGFFSTPPLPRTKPPGTLRIAFLGGSSTAGTVPYLGDEETWPWQVVERLRAALPGREIDFVNAALPGYGTFESYGRLWSRVRFFAPDVVVVYHGWNDMYWFRDAAKASTWRVGRDGGWGFDGIDRVVQVPLTPVPAWAGWSRVLGFAHRAIWPDAGLVGEVGGARVLPRLATSFDPAAVEVFRQNLALMAAAQDVLDFELHVAKQVTLIVPGLDEAARQRCGYRLHGFDHDAHVRAYEAIYSAIDTTLPPDRVIDLTHLSGSTDNLVDHVHLSALGAERVAEGVAAHLLRRFAPAAAPPDGGR